MKCKMARRGISLLLLTGMLLSLVACGKEKAIAPMEIEEVQAVSFNFIGGTDVMPISGYYGPYMVESSVDGESFPNYITDEIFEMITDCGVNMTHYTRTDYKSSPENTKKLLELGEKYGLGIFVQDTALKAMATGKKDNRLKVSERITQYSDYPAFCGVYVADEPGTPYYYPTKEQAHDISAYVPLFTDLNALDIVGSGNLFPVWEKADYEKYNRMLEEYCSTCNPKYLSFDHYVWDKGRTRSGWFYNVDIVRQYAEKYEIPFWVYIQVGSQWNDAAQKFDTDGYYPTEGQLLWNVNASLAYGAKGIEYFPLIQPTYFALAETEPWDFQRNGIIGAAGNKTQWWYYAKTANEQIAAVDSVLMNAVNKGVLASGEEATTDLKGMKYLLEGKTWREVEDIQGNAIVGCFNFKGKSALYVVNYETEKAQKVTLSLKDSYKATVVQRAEESYVDTNQLSLDLKAGEGVLVVFE